MRLSFTGLFVVCLSAMSFAQVEFAPLSSNAKIIEAYQAKMAEWNRDNPIIGSSRAIPCDEASDQEYGKVGGIVYATSGEEKEFCLEQLAFDLLDSVACINCDQLNNGSLSIDQFDFCLTYEANAGINLDFSDTVEILAFESTDTSSVFFPIVVSRQNDSITLATISVQTESTTNLCIPVITLPGTTFEYFVEDCNDPILGNVGNVDDSGCLNYKSNRFGGTDQVCIIVCDEYCVCDTYIFPINIENPPSKQLPFFDDFSNGGPYPISSLWLDDRVWVNNELAYQPPSIGVATFDGIDADGTPYGGGYGPSDVLTSTYIDLSNNSTSDNVNLSFYLSPKGLGYPPTSLDSFRVEFKLQDGTWEEVDGRVADYIEFSGIPFPGILDQIGFGNIVVLPLDDNDYYHENFQFRFINNCNRVGIQYVWHLDYVRLADNVIDPNGSLDDMAFTQAPSLVLKNYNHMPYEQLGSNPESEFNDQTSIELFNHFDVNRSITNASSYTIEDRLSSQILFQDNNFIDAGSVEIPDDFQANSRFSTTLPNIPTGLNFPGGVQGLELETIYKFDVNEEFGGIGPGIKLNNEVSRINYLTDFFGYDDGSAEIAIKMDEEGASIAQEYDLNVADELRGFEIYFPRFGNGQSSGQEFIVKIYEGSLENDPIYTSEEIGVLFPDQFITSIAGFSKYRLYDEFGEPLVLNISAGKMFFAIEQVESGLIYVGFDLNSPQFQSKQYFLNTNTLQWNPQNGPGAYMIRPVFGDDLPPATSVSALNEVLDFEVYPNPAQNELNLKTIGGDYSFIIYDIYGREVLQGVLNGKINVGDLTDGLYYLQLNDQSNDKSGVQKIQILR